MRVPDDVLDEVRERGFSLMEGFLGADELAAAQGALQKHFPRPDEYFADPDAHPHFASSQFAGVEEFPYRSWDLNRLAVHPDLVDAAERYLETAELHLYKVELWAKYSGAVNYDQPLHRDYGSHSLVVPRPEARYQQLTTFIYLSDVTDEDGPTCIVPYEDGKDVPYTPLYLPFGTLADARGAMHRPGGLASGVPDRHLAPGLGHDGRAAVAFLDPRRLPGPRHHVGRQDGLAQTAPRPLGEVHAAVHRAPARPLRVSPAGRSLLDRTDARGRGGALPGPRPGALSRRPDGVASKRRRLAERPSAPTFEVRRVYDPPDRRRVVRVLVDRLWPRGVTKADADIDEWDKDVAPTTALRRWYGHEPERFAEFARRYRDELRQVPARAEVTRLRAMARTRPVVLVTATRDVEHSGARVLCDVLRRRHP